MIIDVRPAIASCLSLLSTMFNRVFISLPAMLIAAVAWAEEPVEFNRDVRPILSNACFACHGPDENSRESGLRLDTQEGAFAELESGEGHSVVPMDLSASQLWQRVVSDDPDLRMPVGGDPLSPREQDILKRWIEQGAQWQQHWAYMPPVRREVPLAEKEGWARNAIDQFLMARLDATDLKVSPRADRTTLIRRLSFDLLGLPPNAEDVDRFLADDRPWAYEALVDRLLASPHFGERMAVYWLDLVRFADTVGYHGDQVHSISPYRDYVINAFNHNKPFDEFTIEQLAGDLLPDATKWQRIASGYNRLLQTTHEGGAQDAEYLAKYAADRVRTTSSVWMGATMGCCECHDHKFDPYTLKDFYQFAAFFADLKEYGAYPAPNSNPTKRVPEILVLEPADERALEQVEKELANAISQLAAHEGKANNEGANKEGANKEGANKEGANKESANKEDTNKESANLKATVAQIEARRKSIQNRGRLTMVSESTTPREMRVLDRGDWMDTSSAIALPAIPEFMGRLDTAGRASRLDLARWLVSQDHPQTSRVMVNRLWQLLTGTGISKVTEDLGSQGEWPVNPELLDWLATEFVDSGWDVKHIVRLIVMSAGYQQTSAENDEQRRLDPANRLLARQSRYRLDAEVIRDSALAVSGLLVDDLGGRSVRPYQPVGYYAHLNFPERKYQHDTGAAQYRRGVYMHWQRQFLHPMLKAFDAPSREECTARRPRSNTPLAALTLLNDPSFIEASRVLAERTLECDASDDQGRLEWLFREALSRSPSEHEALLLLDLVNQQRSVYRTSPDAARELLSIGLSEVRDDADGIELAAWTMVSRAVLNTSEVVMRN